MSSVLHASDEQGIDEIISQNKTTVIVFSAKSWCVPCRRLSPHLEVVAGRLPEFAFVEVDIDESKELRELYKVMTVPYVVAYDQSGIFLGEIKSRTSVLLLTELSKLEV